MKFGKTLRERAEPEYAAYYADYKAMKSYISRLRRGGAHGETEEGFAGLVLSELEKVNEFARVILGKALQLIVQLEENTPAGATLERMSNQVSKEITVFDAFTDLNSNAIRKAVKKYQKKTGESTLWFNVIHGEQFIFLSRRIVHPLLVHFSRVYWACKEAGVPKAPWNPPASFERSTNKFWVHPHKVAEVKAMLLRYLPILELHTPTPPPTIDFFENLDDYSMTPGAITSLYFDCPSNDLPLYHERVALKEGANLLRIRWYGRPQLDHAILQGAPRDLQPPPKLKDSECAFVELKTHHEAWTGDKSVKRRFKLRNSELVGFFEGRKSAKIELDEAEVAQLPNLRSGSGGETKSSKPGDKASPSGQKAAKTRKALIEKLALAQEVQRLVMGKRIRPLLVTEVHRTAFQLSSSNEVRVTLDSPLVGFAMPPPEAMGQSGSGSNAPLADKHFWDSFLSRALSRRAKDQEYHQPFPFAVLELKLQGDPPPWVAGLVNAWTECGYIRCIEKYSKYQHIVNHAIARNPDLKNGGAPSSSLTTVDEDASGSGKSSRKPGRKIPKASNKPRSRRDGSDAEWYRVKVRKVPVWFTALENHGPFPGPPPAANADAYLAEDMGGGSTYGGGGTGNSPRSVYGGSNFGSKPGHVREPSKGSGVSGRTPGGGVSSAVLHRRMDSNASAKSGLGVGRAAGASTGGAGKAKRGKFLSRQLSLRSFQQTVKGHANTINKASNVKVEPKTFFANERTFIQWISAAVFVYGVSTALFAFDASDPNQNGVAIASAAILSAVSLMILIYGAVIFYMRLDRLKSRKDSRVFADKWGPGMLALGLFAAIVTVLVMQVVDFIKANDKPGVSVPGVSEAVAHAQNFFFDGVVYTPSETSRNAALVKMASELESFSPNRAYEFSNLSDGRPTKRVRMKTEYIVASESTADITSLPHGEAVLVSAQEELYVYPGADTSTFDLLMEFYNTASVDFIGPYATATYSGNEETTVRLGVRCVSADGDSFAGTSGWLAAVKGASGTAPTPSSETTLNTYFQNVETALSTHLGTSSYTFTNAGTVYVWSAAFDLEVGGMESTLVWEVEYSSEAEASGTGDDVFDVSLPSTLSLEVAATSGSNFTTWGLASAESFFLQVADGGLTFVNGKECI